MITIEQFKQLELKVATVTQVQEHPNADRLFVVTLDVGGVTKQVVAGIRAHYQPAEPVGKSVVIVDNLEPATIRGVESHGMILAAQGPERLSVVTPDRSVPSGSAVR